MTKSSAAQLGKNYNYLNKNLHTCISNLERHWNTYYAQAVFVANLHRNYLSFMEQNYVEVAWTSTTPKNKTVDYVMAEWGYGWVRCCEWVWRVLPKNTARNKQVMWGAQLCDPIISERVRINYSISVVQNDLYLVSYVPKVNLNPPPQGLARNKYTSLRSSKRELTEE